MSSAKSKSKDKMVSKDAKKYFVNPLGSSNPIGVLASANNPLSSKGSWSEESKHNKMKVSNPPSRLNKVLKVVNDMQEKIHQQNERKHELQKERQAQDLHDLCSGYLISRKIEELAQELVAMGFPHERATMTLILNEGKLEESIAWLLEGGEEEDNHKDKNINEGNFKIDISEELGRIVDLETMYNCSKQEVERRVVACEGDLDKAAEALQELKLDPPFVQPKPVENGDPLSINNNNQSRAINQSLGLQAKLLLSPNQPKKDFNYGKAKVMAGRPSESSRRRVQPPNGISPLSKWFKPQQPSILCDKRWPNNVGSNLTGSYSLGSPLQMSPTTTKTKAIGGEYKKLLPGVARESTIMIQRPQTVNAKMDQSIRMSSYPPRIINTSWYPTNCVEVMSLNNVLSHTTSTRSLGSNYIGLNQIHNKFEDQTQQQFWVSNNHSFEIPATEQGNEMWNKIGASPTLVASPMILSSGLGSTYTLDGIPPSFGSTNSTMHYDYMNIDWSFDRGLSSSNGLCLGISPSTRSKAQLYNSIIFTTDGQPARRSLPTNSSTDSFPGLQHGGVSSDKTSTHSKDWGFPF